MDYKTARSLEHDRLPRYSAPDRSQRSRSRRRNPCRRQLSTSSPFARRRRTCQPCFTVDFLWQSAACASRCAHRASLRRGERPESSERRGALIRFGAPFRRLLGQARRRCGAAFSRAGRRERGPKRGVAVGRPDGRPAASRLFLFEPPERRCSWCASADRTTG